MTLDFPPLPLVAALSIAVLPASAQVAEDPSPNAPAVTDDRIVPEWRLQFENLKLDDQRAYLNHFRESIRLFEQKRIIETLNELAKAESIFPEGPDALNLKGACYVEFRDFDKARVQFEQAYELQKVYMENLEGVTGKERQMRLRPVLNILFNIAEMDFVMRNWQQCGDRIERLLPMMDPDPKSLGMNRLMEFKLLLCKIKLGKIEEARKLADKYDYLDDTPYYYYANAAISYYDKEEAEAERWRITARRVFRNPSLLAPWEDTMIEFGYVKSFYGGEFYEE